MKRRKEDGSFKVGSRGKPLMQKMNDSLRGEILAMRSAWPTTITRHALGNLDHRFELQKHRVLIVPIGEQHFFDAHEVDAAHTEFSAGFVEATRG